MRRTECARAWGTETLMVEARGYRPAACAWCTERLDDASPEKAAEEIIELLRAVQTKLGMGAPVASLVNAKDGCELSFAQYAEPAPTRDRPRRASFPRSSVFVALTAGADARARREASRRG